MPFYIYKVTGPTGRCYIGLSVNVDARWGSHRRRMKTRLGRHPFYDALRAHGVETFTVMTLSEHETLELAQAEEIRQIAAHRPHCYNVSDGGEYDAGTGGKQFWSDIRTRPEDYEAYITKLSAAIKACHVDGRLGPPTHLIELNAARSPRERYKIQARATRVAAKANTGRKMPDREPSKQNPEVGRRNWESLPPSTKLKHSRRSRKNTTDQWARRSSDDVATVGAKIAETLREQYAPGTEGRARLAEVAARGRANMDRSVQGPAASRGLKKFWEDLKADPERYAAYMAARTKSLIATINAK